MIKLLHLSMKDLRGRSGVYKIICNDRFYIGSSKSLYDRLREHRIKLVKSNHPNDFLLKAFTKYGIDNFFYEIIEYCDATVRIEREKHYIDTLKPDFNLQMDPVLKTLSVYSRQKLGKSVKIGREEGRYKSKFDYCKVEQYDYFGNLVKIYDNKETCAKALNITKAVVQRLAGGYKKGLSRKGIRLRYENSNVPVQSFLIDPRYLGKHFDFIEVEKGKETFAFDSVKNVWEYFSKGIMSGKTNFHIKVKIKERGD